MVYILLLTVIFVGFLVYGAYEHHRIVARYNAEVDRLNKKIKADGRRASRSAGKLKKKIDQLLSELHDVDDGGSSGNNSTDNSEIVHEGYEKYIEELESEFNEKLIHLERQHQMEMRENKNHFGQDVEKLIQNAVKQHELKLYERFRINNWTKIYQLHEKQYLYRKAKELDEVMVFEEIVNRTEIPVDRFIEKREESGSLPKVAGVYILHNKPLDKYYVGQSVDIYNRAYQHISGSSNGNNLVYADYKYNGLFTVMFIPLKKSAYHGQYLNMNEDLNALEMDAITLFDAFNNGYNRTRGNTPKLVDEVDNEMRIRENHLELT